MFELWALLGLFAGSFGLGRYIGRRASENSFMGVHVGAGKGSKCHSCGVLVEGGGMDMEAHTRFYCKPLKGR
jgi:hypothetical protein